MFQKVLVPLDGSLFSERALPYAIEITKRFGGEVIFLQVKRPVPLALSTAGVDSMGSPVTTRIIIESAKEEDNRNLIQANRYLKRKLRKVTATGSKGSYHAMLGDPAKAIISFCRKESVDLVVMTTTGKGGLKRAVFGSVTDAVIRTTGIPVLTIRPRSRQRK